MPEKHKTLKDRHPALGCHRPEYEAAILDFLSEKGTADDVDFIEEFERIERRGENINLVDLEVTLLAMSYGRKISRQPDPQWEGNYIYKIRPSKPPQNQLDLAI